MAVILTLLTNAPYLELPRSLLGWAGWLLIGSGLVLAAFHWRGYQRPWGEHTGLFLLLLTGAWLANLFAGLRFTLGAALPVPGLPLAPRGAVWMFFAALPWMLAGGFLGPLSALTVALLGGLTRALWDTHSLFTLLEPALLAVFFSVAVHQRYRTSLYRWLRQPLIAALALLPLSIVLFLVEATLSASGSLAARLDYAVTNLLSFVLATGGELLLGAACAQIVALGLPRLWSDSSPLQPSPAEKSLAARFLIGSGALTFLLLLALLVGNWLSAAEAARQMLQERLATIAQADAESIPFFLETGQNLIGRVASDTRLLTAQGETLQTVLGEQMRLAPFFDQLFVLDANSTLLAAYPPTGNPSLTAEEAAGVPYAFGGVARQVYTIGPVNGSRTGRVAFLATIQDSAGQPQRLLIGRCDLASNPLTRFLIESLEGMTRQGGYGILLDEQGRILYHPDPAQLMASYAGRRSQEASFYDAPSPGGTRDYVYYQPVAGTGWGIVLALPAQQAQQLALQIAAPLAGMILVLGALAFVALRFGLRAITASLRNLAREAGRIAQGELDHPLRVAGVDEVGQLGEAFEQMRISLRARLEELNQLLRVSQEVASSLELEDAIRPILQALRAHGASMARAVFVPAPGFVDESPQVFALGAGSEAYAYLDAAVLDWVQKQERPIFLTDLERGRGLHLPPTSPRPAALAAVAVRHENRFYGALWTAYEQPRSFSAEEPRFLSTLAGLAALAATNARLFRSAEVGRQRLAAILASTPDPVLVTDQQNRLLLANPAARQVLGLGPADGQPTERLLNQKELLELLQEAGTEERSAEIVMPDGKVYFATASAIIANRRPVGRVCVLRDITHFKELDALKSDFVASVSHDLRSPLTLIRGYATMLEMVGTLNEQQKGYLAKIVMGVESMARLVHNLLDLGRIDAGIGLMIEAVPLLEVLANVISTLQLQAVHKQIALGLETAPGLPTLIEADRALLQQALYNLVENAIKYTPNGGQVTLRARARPEGVLFEVQDTGIGIPPADIPRLFERFFRGSSREARQQGGSGLGLAIVRAIAERHGGKVWVESQVGKGSTFFLLIPHTQG